MKRTALCLLAAVTVSFGAIAQTKKPVAKPAVKTAAKPVAKSISTGSIMKNSTDSFSYAVGCNIAASMKQQGVTSINGALLQKAIDDVLSGRTPALSESEANVTLSNKMQALMAQKNAASKGKGEAFLAANKKKPGVKTLANGLQYEVLASGPAGGLKPTVEDTVVVHYVGTLIDGTKFDASTDRGEPAEFPLGGVIRGWTEILQLMTVGDKWKVAIPSDLAYGERGAGATIPGGSALIFEIELLNIKPATK